MKNQPNLLRGSCGVVIIHHSIITSMAVDIFTILDLRRVANLVTYELPPLLGPCGESQPLEV
jgi:hypothetical protein